MVLATVKTEKIAGRISSVTIGYDGTNGTKITQGIKSFSYWRKQDNLRLPIPSSATRNVVQQLGMSYFGWRLRFLSDCRTAFFGTDVQAAVGNQYAMTDNGLSNKIEYFTVIMQVTDSSGSIKTRTYTIHGGYALRNSADIGEDVDAEYVYEGDAEYISYSDA